MRSFQPHRGVRIPQVERAGAFQLIRDEIVRSQVLDLSFKTHLGFKVQGEARDQYATPIRPESLTDEELEAVVGIIAAQVADIHQAKRDAAEEARQANADAKASAASQIEVLRAELKRVAEVCPLFAVAINTGLNKAEDQARAVASSRVLPQESAEWIVPDSLAVALDACQAELSKRTAVTQTENVRLRAMLERAGISIS